MSPRLSFTLLRAWHAVLAGGFVVAWASADEDTYAMHQFSGYVVLAAIVVRLVAAVLAPPASPWRLSLPRLPIALKVRGRHPLLGWFAVALVAGLGLSAASGVLADAVTWMEHPHEAISEILPWLVGAHVLFVVVLFGGKRLMARLRTLLVPAALVVLAALPIPARAENAATLADSRGAILQSYAAQDAGHQGFSAQRGEALFRTAWKGGDERTPSCTACHTDQPRQPGRNAKTGRPIDPVAVSVNPTRFTDAELVEKQFARDCKSVLGRACTPREKGDYITFLKGQ